MQICVLKIYLFYQSPNDEDDMVCYVNVDCKITFKTNVHEPFNTRTQLNDIGLE